MDEKTKSFFRGLVNGEEKEEEVEVKPAKMEIEPAASKPAAKPAPNAKNGNEEEFDEAEGQLTVDVYQTPDEIVVKSAVAGVTQDDLDIDISSESVSIRGRRPRDEKIREEDYLWRECYWGRFSRTVNLPQEIDADRASASLKNGILTVRLPKLSRQKTKKLKVKFD